MGRFGCAAIFFCLVAWWLGGASGCYRTKTGQEAEGTDTANSASASEPVDDFETLITVTSEASGEVTAAPFSLALQPNTPMPLDT
jgi:hypothetical protein